MSGTKQVSVPLNSIVLMFKDRLPTPFGKVMLAEGLISSMSMNAVSIKVAVGELRS